MDLEKECTMLVGKEFRVEERTLYHVELPSKKTVAVKAAPSLPVVEALRPLLQKYGYQLDNIIIHVVCGRIVCLKIRFN